MSFKEWLKAGIPREYEDIRLFLRDSLDLGNGSYDEFLESIGLEPPEIEEAESMVLEAIDAGCD